MPASFKTLALGAGAAALALAAAGWAQGARKGVSDAAPKTIDLGEAFPALDGAKGHAFRARLLELAPGATAPAESAKGRPVIAYVAAGAVREHRAGAASPKELKKADASFDKGGEVLRWENAGDTAAALFIVDIAPQG